MQVTFSADRYPAGWRFAVRDNGMGIRAESPAGQGATIWFTIPD
ncbi:MAG: hypothetical protein ACM30G_11575 [Micromonosporaceae bacterium]